MSQKNSVLSRASTGVKVKRRLKTLIAFLEDNSTYPERYRRHALKKRLYLHDSAGAKLTALFANAVMSNAGGALEKPGLAVKQFAKCVDPLRSNRTTKALFLERLSAKDVDDLFLRLQDFPCVGRKKAALFLRDLYETQELVGESRIFKRRFIDAEQLLIPFDVVIASVLNVVFGSRVFWSQADLRKHFADLTAWAHQVSPGNHMVLEDLWYWGYFCLQGTGFTRQVALNEAKIHLDDAFAGYACSPEQFKSFIGLLREWE